MTLELNHTNHPALSKSPTSLLQRAMDAAGGRRRGRRQADEDRRAERTQAPWTDWSNGGWNSSTPWDFSCVDYLCIYIYQVDIYIYSYIFSVYTYIVTRSDHVTCSQSD